MSESLFARVRPSVSHAVDAAFEGRPVTDANRIGELFEIPLPSAESALLMAAARELSRMACNGKAEVHAQIAVNVGPCPRQCLFCAFAECNHVFTESKEFPPEYVIEQCLQFERDGANAVFLMATGQYPFRRFLDYGAAVRQALQPETVLIANVGDFNVDEAKELSAAGFAGVYHAVRLGEGEVTKIPVARRVDTFRAAKEAGLSVGTCLEPVGPEHTTAELVEKLLITRDVQPTYSGAARRIPIPGTELARHGQVSELRMAHILAVTRVVLPLTIAGHCTHEPNVLGAVAGANLMWAERGANPRDTHERTEEGRGMTVPQCRAVLAEADWQCLHGPSCFYADAARTAASR